MSHVPIKPNRLKLPSDALLISHAALADDIRGTDILSSFETYKYQKIYEHYQLLINQPLLLSLNEPLLLSLNQSIHSLQTPTMRFTVPLLSLASIGLNVLPALSATVPSPDLARRAEQSVNYAVRSDDIAKRHRYQLAEDEVAKRDANEKRHRYELAEEESA